MHEWALAEGVIETVKRHLASRKNARVIRVNLLLGELQSVDREIFLHGLRIQVKDTPLTSNIFHFGTAKAIFRCRKCENEWNLEDIPDLSEEDREAIHFLPEASKAYMRCPNCHSPDFLVEGGRGVSIESIEIEEPI